MPKIFLSYARSDLKSARRLYNALSEATDHDIWFDKVSLPPGVRWEPAIRKAIRESRYFLGLFSKASVTARGYRHSELRQAMEVLAEFPTDQVYLIPVRLDDCAMPDPGLDAINRVDLFPSWKDGVTDIIRAVGNPRPSIIRKPVAGTEERPQYRIALLDLGLDDHSLPHLAAELNDIQSFFVFSAPKSPSFRRVTQRIDDRLHFQVDRVPPGFFEQAKYLAVDLIACFTRYPLAFTKDGYLYSNYFAKSAGPQGRFLFLSADQLKDFTSVVSQTIDDGLVYILIGELVDFFTDLGYHHKTRDCLMDHCGVRSDIVYGLNARQLCRDCARKVRTPGLREAVDAMLAWRSK